MPIEVGRDGERRYVDNMYKETTGEKFKRKFAMEPMIPLGCVATVGILVAGLANFRKGGSASTSQKMMRFRVIAQGFTVAAFVAGAGVQAILGDE